jgi:hypothetical protein
VVQRSEEQHRVSASVGHVQLTRVGNHRLDARVACGCPPQLFDMQRHQVTVDDPIPQLRKPQRVTAGPSTHISDDGGRWGQMPEDYLLRAHELELSPRLVEPPFLLAEFVVLPHRGVRLTLTHDP